MARNAAIYIGVLVIACCLNVMGQSDYMKYKDSKQSINVRIEDLMSRMSLEEKIGQMTQIERTLASPEVMNKYFIGNISFSHSKIVMIYDTTMSIYMINKLCIGVHDMHNVGSVMSEGGSAPGVRASADAWVNMVNEIQKGALSTRLAIPMIYGIDAVHGHNTVYGATIFPHNIGLGATRQVVLWFYIYHQYKRTFTCAQAHIQTTHLCGQHFNDLILFFPGRTYKFIVPLLHMRTF